MYFEHKLKYLLKVHEDSSFQNLHILISDFIKDTKLFIQEILKKQRAKRKWIDKNLRKDWRMLKYQKQNRNRFFFMNAPKYYLNIFLQSLKQ